MTIEDHGEVKTLIGYGNGPIDAVKNAFNSTDDFLYTDLMDYSEHALTAGSNSKAAAYVQLRPQGEELCEYGVGVHLNITTATIKAMISAMNRIYKNIKKEG